MCKILNNEVNFQFGDTCVKPFKALKRKFIKNSILIAPDWELLFKLLCNAPNVVVGALLGKPKVKVFYLIYYTRKTLDAAQAIFRVTKKRNRFGVRI